MLLFYRLEQVLEDVNWIYQKSYCVQVLLQNIAIINTVKTYEATVLLRKVKLATKKKKLFYFLLQFKIDSIF